MRDLFRSFFVKEKYKDSYEMQNFNLVQLIFLIGLSLLAGVIYVCIPNENYLYYSILMIFMLFITLLDANRTGSIEKAAIIVSLVTNLLYLPLCFYGFGKLICCVPMYYILGIMYSVLLVHGKHGLILSIFETIYMCLITVHIGSHLPAFYENRSTFIDYVAIVIGLLIVGGLAVLATRTKIIQYRLETSNMKEAHLKVIDAYNSKDIFFANTSHEIRTPLNAIVGTVNLLLDEDLDSKTRENVYNILNSCNALLSITDELMALSNTENDDPTISEYKYDFSEMMMDIVNMMAVRLMESPVVLYVNIDKSLPKYLYGDGSKVRQLFINILNNAVKYTKEGKIIFSVIGHKTENDNIELHVEVKDTGIGIKPEALSKLFDDYTRDEEDEEKRTIEGTGLGLSLCKDLCESMGGYIKAESEYHVGSNFIFEITQKIYSLEPVARVSSRLRKPAIIFENNDELAESLKSVLESLNILSVVVHDRMGFEDCIVSDRYKYIFISSDRYNENKRFIDRKISEQRIVVITDISKSVQIERNCYIVTRPLNIINVAMAYNNEIGFFSREIIQKGSFSCPEANILVVDDNLTNLEVASGLLKKYKANIITAISGPECLNIMEKTEVDLIFMDYMMPDMNGIDTLYALRGLESINAQTVPAIALTANVVSGAREMFLDAGFAAYMSKPIDTNRLESVLKTYIPREKIRVSL